jgi:hypothetical protein
VFAFVEYAVGMVMTDRFGFGRFGGKCEFETVRSRIHDFDMSVFG